MDAAKLLVPYAVKLILSLLSSDGGLWLLVMLLWIWLFVKAMMLLRVGGRGRLTVLKEQSRNE